MTLRTTFPSARDHCAAWLTLPEDAEPPHPAVILVHGGGATHAMRLAQYEAAFSGAGFAVLAFDFRGFGESPGVPRQLMSPRRYREDVDAALAFAREHPDLDAERLALWGTSFGASHVFLAAARHHDVAAAVVQCPVLGGRPLVRAASPRALARLTVPVLDDAVRALTRRPRRYVQIVGRPGERAFVDKPGALEGWYSVAPDPAAFDNRVAAATGIGLLFHDGAGKAESIRCPVLVCVSDHEELVDASLAARAAAAVPRGVAIHYPAGHFDVYHPPLLERLLADQIAFLSQHLRAASPPPAPSRSRATPARPRVSSS